MAVPVEKRFANQKSSPNRSDDQVLPPPLPKPKKSNRTVPLIVAGAIIGVVLIGGTVFLATQFQYASPPSVQEDPTRELEHDQSTREKMIDLLCFTDTTLRLMQETSDAELAREYIDKWSAMQNSIPLSGVSKASLEVIEGQLNSIQQRLYPRKTRWSASDSLGWRDATEWYENKDSEESIRFAQSQILRSFEIPWKESQKPRTFQSKEKLLLGALTPGGSILLPPPPRFVISATLRCRASAPTVVRSLITRDHR